MIATAKFETRPHSKISEMAVYDFLLTWHNHVVRDDGNAHSPFDFLVVPLNAPTADEYEGEWLRSQWKPRGLVQPEELERVVNWLRYCEADLSDEWQISRIVNELTNS